MTVSSAILVDRAADRAPALMQVAGLSKRYGEQRALADISFAMNAGEVLGLIGPNGAGKTTLMEAVAGVLAADDGRVLWRGTSLALPQRREFMFYLPDGLRPWEDQYVARVIEFFAAVYGRPEIIVADTIRSLGLAPVLRKRIVEGLWPTAHAGARLADYPSAAADGRAVRRLRPAANARDHERTARCRAQWAHARSRHPPVGRCRARLRPLRAAGGRTRPRRRHARSAARAGRQARGRTGGGVPCAHLTRRRPARSVPFL